MHFIVKTTIGPGNKEAVMAGFTSALFLRLAPPFPRLTLLRYDGCSKGDEIHLELGFLFYRKKWISLITENGTTAGELYFVDEGIRFPAPIKRWKHRHVVRQTGTDIEIEDNVLYSSGNKLLDLMLFLPLYLLFLYRKPVYRNYFDQSSSKFPI